MSVLVLTVVTCMQGDVSVLVLTGVTCRVMRLY